MIIFVALGVWIGLGFVIAGLVILLNVPGTADSNRLHHKRTNYDPARDR